MSIQSMQSTTTGFAQGSGIAIGQSPLPRPVVQSDIPKVKAPATQPASPDLLKNAVDEANVVLSQTRPDIKFVIDSESNKVVIKLIEPDSGEVINQYPTEQAVAISNAIAQTQAQIAERHAAYKSGNESLLGLFIKHRT